MIRSLATWLILVLGVIGPAYPVSAETAIEEQDGLGMPEAADMVGAYLTARRWLDAFDLPPRDDPQSRIRISGATGVCVVLRRNGRVIGSASTLFQPDDDDELALRLVLGRAMNQVLNDPAVKNLPESMIARIGGALTLELDVAGRREPLLGRSFPGLARRLEPGLDGVAMRRGNRWTSLFPAEIRATNSATRLEGRLAGMPIDLGLNVADLETLIDRHNIALYRFRTTHLTQTAPEAVPFETLRGDRLVTDREITADRIKAMADQLAAHMLRRIWPGPHAAEDHPMTEAALGMMGDYRPVSDRYDPLIAPPLEQALSALALMRYAEVTRGRDGQAAEEAVDGARRILADLAVVEDGETDPRDEPEACAAVVVVTAALSEQERKKLGDAWEDFYRDVRRVVVQSAGLSATDAAGGGGRLSPHGSALVAMALVSLLESGEADVTAEQIRQAIDVAWEGVAEPDVVTLLPWIGWAATGYADQTGEPVPHAEALREAAKMLYRTRQGHEAGKADLDGGFTLAGPRGAMGGSRPTAQTARPAVWLATMLRDERLTPPEGRSAALGRHLQTIRFLAQLTVRESLAWSYPNAERALGGVRAATWDATLPAGAQAMALLTLAETIESLAALD